jgi:methionyl-tRNA formyltransferase
MRIAVIGQQDFGKAVLEAFLAREHEVAAVFCAPEKEGARPDALRAAAQGKGLRVNQFKSLRSPEASEAMRDANADIGIMAFVTQFAPREFVAIPKHGTIQYHPSLLPKYRGPSSINWPIIKGDTETGLAIFRPTDGLDEGAIILQKTIPIGPDDTIGSVDFDRLFPMGVQALLEAAELVFAGKHQESVQDESQASYEGWCRTAEAKIDWAKPIDHIYNLIRGCNPAPGAWTTLNGEKLQIFDARKTVFRRFADVPGKIGEVTDVTSQSFKITGQGGMIEVLKARLGDGKKVSGGELAQTRGIRPGTSLGAD